MVQKSGPSRQYIMCKLVLKTAMIFISVQCTILLSAHYLLCILNSRLEPLPVRWMGIFRMTIAIPRRVGPSIGRRRYELPLWSEWTCHRPRKTQHSSPYRWCIAFPIAVSRCFHRCSSNNRYSFPLRILNCSFDMHIEHRMKYTVYTFKYFWLTFHGAYQ